MTTIGSSRNRNDGVATPSSATPLNPAQIEAVRDILLRDSYLVQRWDDITSCSPNSLNKHSPLPRRQQRQTNSNMKQVLLVKLQVWRNIVGQSANLDCLIALLKSRGVRMAADELVRKRDWIQSIGQPPTIQSVVINPIQNHEHLQEKRNSVRMNSSSDRSDNGGSPGSEIHYLHPDAAGGAGYGWQQRHNSADSGIVDPSAVEEDDDEDEDQEIVSP